MCELGWKSLGVLELTALPSIDAEQWVPLVQETDAGLRPTAPGPLPGAFLLTVSRLAAAQRRFR
jgi:hypothetical protein